MNIAIVDDEFKTIIKDGVANSMIDTIQSCIEIVQNICPACYSCGESMKQNIILKLTRYKTDIEELKEMEVKDFEKI